MSDKIYLDPLWVKMERMADEGHHRSIELREKAEAFRIATDGFYSEPQTVGIRSFMGAWARARRCYSECAGVPLMGD